MTMRNPILPIAIAFVLAAPCTALAGDKNKSKGIELQDYGFGTSMPVTTSRSDGGGTAKVTSSGTLTHRKAGGTQQEYLRSGAGPTGLMPGSTTCAGGACPEPVANSKLLGSGGTSGAVAGNKAKLSK
jgi:hypothetical protein